ncbi:MAG: thioredoxin domain-containing protein [bacterium]
MHQQKNNLVIPAAILLAGFAIATGIYLSNKSDTPNVNTDNTVKQSGISIKPVSKEDHILGNPDAPVTIVEFSDTECSFCKRFQTTMQTVIDNYGKDGKVAWVYRHFPLDSLHSKARKEAEATECANELGGNTAFWKMLDTIYANTPGNNGLDATKLPEFAKSSGVDVTKFNTCLASGKYAATVEADFQDGVKAGAQGTPYNVLVLKDKLSSDAENTIQDFVAKNGLAQNIIISSTKKEVVLSGALPVEMINTILDAILK